MYKQIAIIFVIGLFSGCICCSSLGIGVDDVSCPEGTVLVGEICCIDADENSICDETEQTTTTTTVSTTTSTSTTTTTTGTTTTTQSTSTTLYVTRCVRQFQVRAGEVVFLYDFRSHASLVNTVNHIGLRFEKLDLSFKSAREKSILKCFNIEPYSEIPLAMFLCAENNERMIIEKGKFQGASEKIREFYFGCQNALDER